MKSWFSISSLLLAVVSLCGCGGGTQTAVSPGPPPLSLNLAGNWQFNTASTDLARPSLTIAGSVNQSGSAVSAAFHVEGSSCYDQLITMAVTGSFAGSNMTLKSTSIDGQVAAFTGGVTDTTFRGTYAINGGCSDGDHGNVTGTKMPSVTGHLTGSFTPAGQLSFDAVADVNQGNAGPDGSFAIAGTATFATPCFTSGTIASGTFLSGSFIVGTTVALQIQTGNGTVTVRGTMKPATGEITGDYLVTGGTCDQTGTVDLIATSPWDY